jgi:hypothetical protein
LKKEEERIEKKKRVKLWNNCIQLSRYSGLLNVNYQYMLKRREYIYKYEIVNYSVFGYEKTRKEANIVYKGIIETKMNESQDCKLEVLNYE